MYLINVIDKKGKLNGRNGRIFLFLQRTMRSFRYILAISLSLLIVFAGVGISVMHYCCLGCEAEQKCCVTGCEKCRDTNFLSDNFCGDDGCEATVYKVDLMKHSCECASFIPFMQFFCYLLPDRERNFSFVESVRTEIKDIPPNSLRTPRYYLTLYSIFLI